MCRFDGRFRYKPCSRRHLRPAVDRTKGKGDVCLHRGEKGELFKSGDDRERREKLPPCDRYGVEPRQAGREGDREKVNTRAGGQGKRRECPESPDASVPVRSRDRLERQEWREGTTRMSRQRLRFHYPLFDNRPQTYGPHNPFRKYSADRPWGDLLGEPPLVRGVGGAIA